MVLSNKKLKQKLRANLAESLTESVSQNNPTITTIKDSTDAPNSQTQLSLKSLLDSAIQKPRLSKREKKRREKNVSPQEEEEEDSSVLNTTNGGAAESHNEGGPEGVKKNKRKRDGENGDSENLEEDGNKLKKKKKNKKKKKKKDKKKREVGDVEMKKNVGESIEMGVSGEQSVAGTIKTGESQEKVDLSTKVYVGGIPYYSTEDDIRSFFEGCGSIIEIDCMKFPDSGKFRGIAIISFKTEAAAKRALELDGADMGGLFLKIQLYKATREHRPSDFSPAIIDGYNRIYIGNLSWDIAEDDLRKFFTDCNISSIRFGEDKETGAFRGYAHVDFADSLSVTMALKLDQKIVCGRPARIRCAVPKKAATPDSKFASTGEKDDNRGSSSNLKFTPTIEKDDYVGSSSISKSVEMSEKADNGGVSTVSGKIRRRTCYECGEKGHLSSACPKLSSISKSVEMSEKDVNVGLSFTSKSVEMSEKDDNGGLSFAPKSVEMSEKANNGGVSAVSGKIRRRTCYECGEKGHLSSACPKLSSISKSVAMSEKDDNGGLSFTSKSVEMSEKDDNVGLSFALKSVEMSEKDDHGGVSAVSGKIRRRTCYECGEKGHLSLACPKKQASEAIIFGAS